MGLIRPATSSANGAKLVGQRIRIAFHMKLAHGRDGDFLVVGRLAPSPTGGLHLGHARTFLIAWLAARRAGGRVILRIEDLDRSRARSEAVQTAIEDIHWLGLDWDEGPDIGGRSAPYLQSERTESYEHMLESLKKSESVYPCTCTRADVARAASAPHGDDLGPAYTGTCSHRSVGDATALEDRPFSWRFRVPPGWVEWDDLFLGRVALDPARLGGDFIVARNQAGHSYQLAVVADDFFMGVNQVIRGNDLVPSTPRQILLYRQAGWPEPVFGHVSLAVEPDGRRLAKRDGSLKLATLREKGVDSRILIGALAHSCGWTQELTPMAPRDAISMCNPLSVSQEPWVVTREWLAGIGRTGRA
jgi:glutamyl-tRNA synthetase